MSSGDYTFDTPEYLGPDPETYWNTDTSQFLWDSPHPDDYQAQTPEPQQQQYTNIKTERSLTPVAAQSSTASRAPPVSTDKHPLSNSRVPHGTVSAPSTASEASSQSPNSDPSQRSVRKSSSESSPQEGQDVLMQQGDMTPPGGYKMEGVYEEDDDTYQFGDATYPSVGMGMDNLSLNPGSSMTSPDFKYSAASPDPLSAGLFADRNDTYSPRQYSALRNYQSNQTSPQMTVQPSKMFFLGNSRENSPMMPVNEESSAAFFNGNSPLSTTSDAFGNNFGGTPNLSSMMFDSNGNDTSQMPTSRPPGVPKGKKPGLKWPCKLTVEPIPDKSRVETQIPIKLTLYNVPSGIQRIHLPPHTISKPKFQAKPPFKTSADTLELSTMLVCASAMQKDGLEELAFQRAAADDVFGLIEDSKINNNPADENDPMKPLNGGPVAICQGCIVRERKRAARKKTKKAEEEEEWAKDEAKRVIVFNCSEVRDWCVPGTKETAVRDHDTPVETMFVNAPMRIACYCRHQSEKVGFQVIFTIKTPEGKILAQAMSDSIMITDDHKQPSANTSLGMPFPGTQLPGAGMFTPGQAFGMYPTFQQDMPFRSSWSTNDLRTLNQYAPQRRPQNFQRQNSTGYNSQVSTATNTATATPRNLSRPASPTSPTGHSQKKRRSGGATHGKLPSGLTMTRIEDMSPNTAATLAGTGPLSAGATQSNFNFSVQSTNPFTAALEQQFGPTPSETPNPYASQPQTPLTGGLAPAAFGTGGSDDRYTFYSAPTSQHPSRAPSPTSTRSGPGFSSSMQIPQQAAYALAALPAGLNIQRPPIIQRLIPNMGPTNGGEEVTVLGSGFFHGLEVMFGDNPATNTTFWGDTTLVCRAPPSDGTGTVPVLFGHQHRSAPPELQQLQGLLPSRLVPYTYMESGEPAQQMHGMNMSAGMTQQQQPGQAFNINQMSQEDLARAFAASGGYANFARRRPAG